MGGFYKGTIGLSLFGVSGLGFRGLGFSVPFRVA